MVLQCTYSLLVIRSMANRSTSIILFFLSIVCLFDPVCACFWLVTWVGMILHEIEHEFESLLAYISICFLPDDL